jgi:ferric-dicitrate binding protein FerR (iron transport regulator)
MNDSTDDSDLLRMEQLANDKCNGALGPEGHAELHELLAKSPRLRSLYWQITAVHADLEWDHLGNEAPLHDVMRRFSEDLEACKTSSRSRWSGPRNVTRTWRRSWVIAATIVAVLLGGWTLSPRDETNLATRTKESRNVGPAPAQLTSLAPGARWSYGRPGEWNPEDLNYGDTVTVDEGAVEMYLENGAVGELRAPVVMQLISQNRVRLLSGKIKVSAPETAYGFTVETPSAEVVDLGTVFSVEAADTGTDLVVYGGKVDIKVPSNGQQDSQPAQTKQFTTGQAVRVAPNGTLSRIMHVQSPDDSAEAGEPSRSLAITSVADNMVRDDFWTFYEVVPRGMAEDAPAYVDRFFQWNGVTPTGIPAYLVGGDYVKMFNDDKMADEYQVDVTVSQPVTLYVLLDKRVAPPTWLTSSFTDTGDQIGMDESSHHLAGAENTLGVGPGESIERTRSIWKTTVPKAGTITLGPNGEGWSRAISMYGIVAVPLKQNE